MIPEERAAGKGREEKCSGTKLGQPTRRSETGTNTPGATEPAHHQHHQHHLSSVGFVFTGYGFSLLLRFKSYVYLNIDRH